MDDTPHTGDAHWYPAVPQSLDTDHFIRGLGHEDKPVFLSEYGIGSLMDVIDEWRRYEQVGAHPDLEDATMFREQSEGLLADWKRLGFDGVYPFPEDLLRESQRLHARQRTLGFNCIRSNPRLCGYNLTGMLDHGMTGEGRLTLSTPYILENLDSHPAADRLLLNLIRHAQGQDR